MESMARKEFRICFCFEITHDAHTSPPSKKLQNECDKFETKFAKKTIPEGKAWQILSSKDYTTDSSVGRAEDCRFGCDP